MSGHCECPIRSEKLDCPEPSRVLIAEDDPVVAEGLKRLLRCEGFDTRTAPGYQEALALADAWQPDLLLSDLSLPGGDGLELMKELRHVNPHLRGIALSGWACQPLAIQAERAGYECLIAKPFDPVELLECLRRILAV